MIKNSFILLDNVGYLKERKIWGQGIFTWDDFISQNRIDGLSVDVKKKHDKELELALFHLEKEIPHYFCYRLPRSEHWRLYDELGRKACFLDIETTGLGKDHKITVLSIYNGKNTKTFVNGINLTEENLKRELSKYLMVITFYGSAFDLPFISRSFPSIKFGIPHLDLCFAGRRVGLKGGLKKIERDLGISREEDICTIDGYEAVRLWKRWEKYRDRDSLDLLVRYNQYDVINLKPLADTICDKIKKAVIPPYLSSK
jgi:hypothetical protein